MDTVRKIERKRPLEKHRQNLEIRIKRAFNKQDGELQVL
jgi:hypothetical protein